MMTNGKQRHYKPLLARTRSVQGVRYGYYVCSGRASKRKNCTRRAVPIGVAEQLVADCYQDIAITEADYTALAAQVEAAFDERLASRSQELAELTENRQRLQNESDKLLAAHFADAIDLETLKRHQDRIRTGLADIDRRLASEHDHHTGARKQLSTALSLLVDCAALYARTGDQGKWLANQALTDGIEISEDERATIRLAEPFAALTPEPASTDVRSSSTSSIVEPRGLEPLTPCLQSRCATNCAKAPCGSRPQGQPPQRQRHCGRGGGWWAQEDLNLRPLRYQRSALTA